MSEQIVEIIIRERKFSFRIPYSDYIPFKKAEKSVVSLIEEIGPEDDELDFGIVYSAVKLAIENNKLREKLNICLLYTSPSPRDLWISRMPSSA